MSEFSKGRLFASCSVRNQPKRLLECGRLRPPGPSSCHAPQLQFILLFSDFTKRTEGQVDAPEQLFQKVMQDDGYFTLADGAIKGETVLVLARSYNKKKKTAATLLCSPCRHTGI